MRKTNNVTGQSEQGVQHARLVIKLLGDDEKIDELLEQIDILSREANSYEYGLPLLEDGQKEILRKAILKWVAGL